MKLTAETKFLVNAKRCTFLNRLKNDDIREYLLQYNLLRDKVNAYEYEQTQTEHLDGKAEEIL
jgi:hypothetical protein